MENWQLKQRQGLPLEAKVRLAQRRIQSWHEHWDGMTYIAFSGGKDSTVLLHLVRNLYPGTPAVFNDTGLEYPDILAFVKRKRNVVWNKPRMNFKQVIERWGYPVVSKDVAVSIDRYRRTKNPAQRHLRLWGGINPTSGKEQRVGIIPQRWHCLAHDESIKISDECCRIMKKDPAKRYERATGRKAYLGIMAEDSNQRKVKILQHGCNAWDLKRPQSRPMACWFTADVWEYIKTRRLAYAEIYDKGAKNTGCMFCMFGIHKEKEGEGRFDLLKKYHPRLYQYCMEDLGCRRVLRAIRHGNQIPFETMA